MPSRKLLFHSGKICTLDPRRPHFQAVIVANGRIAWLGQNQDLVAIPADEYEIIDLEGLTMLPSFCDAHMHFVFWALSLGRVDLDGARAYSEALARIARFDPKLKPGDWLIGKGWHREDWRKKVWPHKRDLDRLVPRHPAAIYSKDEHLLWVNSQALKRARIDSKTPDPAGGKIDRDGAGEPTGILREKACDLVWRRVKQPGTAAVFKQIEAAQVMAHSLGITALGNFDGITGFRQLQDYHRQRGLKLRVAQYLPVAELEHALALGLRSGFGDDRLKVQGVKIFADGALGSQTALMFKPYRGPDGNCGIAQTEPAELRQLVARSASGGLSVAIHAIGDKANYHALSAFAALPRRRSSALRHRIEHCQLLRPQDIAAFARYDVIASVQPSHLVADLDMVNRYWGARGRYAYAFRSLQAAGARLAFGSDAPIEKPSPLWGIHCAVTRRRLEDGRRLYPRESLSIDQAVRAHTCGGAYAMGDEDKFGVLSVGRYADMIIIDQDLLTAGPERITQISVLATLFEGEFVYGCERFAAFTGC